MLGIPVILLPTTVWIRGYRVRATNKQGRKKKEKGKYNINSEDFIRSNFAWRWQVHNKIDWNKVFSLGNKDIDILKQI